MKLIQLRIGVMWLPWVLNYLQLILHRCSTSNDSTCHFRDILVLALFIAWIFTRSIIETIALISKNSLNVVIYISVFLGYFRRYSKRRLVTNMSVNHTRYGVPMCYENPRRTSFEHVDVANPVRVIGQSDKRYTLGLTAITRCRAHVDGCSAL